MQQHKLQPKLSSVAVLAMLLASSLPLLPPAGATEPQRTVILRETWDDPSLPEWSVTGALGVGDCVTFKEGSCSLRVDPQQPGQAGMVRVERDVNHTMGPAPYEARFWFRNEEVNGYTEHWVHLELPEGGYVRLEMTHGAPNNRVVLNTSRALTPAFATYASDAWYQAILTVDPVERKAKAEVRDASDNLKGATAWVPIADNATRIGRVSFLSQFTGTDILNHRAYPMHYDTLRILTARSPLHPALYAGAGPAAGQITLNWTPPQDDGGSPITRYNVYGGPSSDNLSQIAVVLATNPTLSYTESGLSAGEWRYYKVRGVNAMGEGDWSNEASARTYAYASAPLNLTVTASLTHGEVTVSFDPPADAGGTPVVSYEFFRGPSADALTLVAQTPPTAWWRDYDLPPNTAYYYGVRAITGAGAGVMAGPVQVTTAANDATWDECDLFRYLIDQPNLLLSNDNKVFCTVTQAEIDAAPVPYLNPNGTFNRTMMDQFLARMKSFADSHGIEGLNLSSLDELISPQPDPPAWRGLEQIDPRRCLDCDPTPDAGQDQGCIGCEPIPEDERQGQVMEYMQRAADEVSRGADPAFDLVNGTKGALIGGEVDRILADPWSAENFSDVQRRVETVLEGPVEAVAALAKCTDPTLNGTLETVGSGVLNVTLVDETTTCISEVIRPLLWDLLGRVRGTVNALAPVTQLVENTTRPAVGSVSALLPPTIRSTTDAFLEDPTGFVSTGRIGLDDLDLSLVASDAVTNTEAQVQVAAANLTPANARHPQLVYNTLALLDKDGTLQPLSEDAQQQLGDYNWHASNLTGDRVNPIAAVDSLVYNLYTRRNNEERITPVLAGTRTCVQLDNSILTRDVHSCDLYANFTVTTESVSSEALGTGRIVNLALQLQKANPAAAFSLEALGYIQVFNEPYVLVLGYNVTDTLGVPLDWRGAFTGYDTRLDQNNRNIGFQASYTDARPTIPMNLTAAAFRVNVSQPGKPIIPGNHTSLFADSAAMPPSVGVTQSRTASSTLAGAAAVANMAITLPQQASLDVNVSDVVAHYETTQRFAGASLPSGKSEITYTRGPDRINLTWDAPASGSATAALNVTYTEGNVSTPTRAFQAVGQDVPATFWLKGDFGLNDHRYDATAAPTKLSLVAVEGAHACPSRDDVAGNSLVATRSQGRDCLSAKTDGLTSLGATTTPDASFPDTQARAWGRGQANADPVVVTVDSPFQLWVKAENAPATWDAKLLRDPTGKRIVRWDASEDSAMVNVSIAVPQEGGGRERAKLNASAVPTTLTAAVDPALQLARVEGSAAYGLVEGWITDTERAPTREPFVKGSHYLRAKRPLVTDQVESAFRTGATDGLVAEVGPEGEFTLRGTLNELKTVSAFYQDESKAYAMSVEIRSVKGTLDTRLSASRALGTFTYNHSAGNNADRLIATGETPQGNVHLDLTNAPARFGIDASWLSPQDPQGNPTPQSFRMWGSSNIVEARATFAATGEFVDRTDQANTLLVFQGGGTLPQGFHLKASNFKDVTATHDGGAIHLATSQTTGTFGAYFEQAGSEYDLVASPATNMDAALRSGNFTYSAVQPTATSVLYRASSASGQYAKVNASGLGKYLTMTWPTQRTTGFEMDLKHDQSPTLGAVYVDVQESQQSTSPSGWNLSARGVPRSVRVIMDASTGHAEALPKDASGAAATVTELGLAFMNRGPNLKRADHAGDYVRLHHGDEGDGGDSPASGALWLTNASRLVVDLLPAGVGTTNGDGLARVQATRSAAADMHLEATSTSRSATVRFGAANATGTIDARLLVDSATGAFDATTNVTPSGAASQWNGSVADRNFIVKSEGGAPTSYHARWTVGGVLNATSSPAANVSAATWRHSEGQRPHAEGKDHLAARIAADTTSMGMAFTKAQSVDYRHPDQAFGLRGEGSTRPLLVEINHADRTMGLLANQTPTRLDAEWVTTTAARELRVASGSPAAGFVLDVRTPNVGRLRAQSPLLPAGDLHYTEDRVAGTVDVQATTAVGTLVLTADDGLSGEVAALRGHGLEFSRASDQQVVRLHADNLTGLSYPYAQEPYAAVAVSLARASGAPAGAFNVSIQDAGRIANARLDGVGGGRTVLAWGEAGNTTENFRMRVHGAPGASLRMGYQAPSGDHGMVHLSGAPSDWTLRFDPAGVLAFGASASTTTLVASGSWSGGAFVMDAAGVPSTLDVEVAGSMLTGKVNAASGAAVSRLDLGMTPRSATGAAGVVPVTPANGRSLLLIDSAEAGGALSLNLTDLQSASWSIPGQTGSGSLRIDIRKSVESQAEGLVDAGHPEHRTRITFSGGLPTLAHLNVTPTLSGWTSFFQTQGRDAKVAYQDTAGRGFNLTATTPPTGFVAQYAPKREASPLRVNTTGALTHLELDSVWDGGSVRGTIQGLPDGAVLDTTVRLVNMSGRVWASSAPALVDLLLIPDTTNTVNHVEHEGDYLAVEAGGKAPYLSLVAHDLLDWTWWLPDASTHPGLEATLIRSAAHTGSTQVDLASRAGDDLTMQATDAGSTIRIRGEGASPAGATNPQPARMTLASAGTQTASAAATMVTASTGQAARAAWDTVPAGTTSVLEASGAGNIHFVSTGTPPGKVELKTTDQERFLNLTVEDPTNDVEARFWSERCTTPNQPFMEVLTGGTTGRFTLQYGAGGAIPAPHGSEYYMDVRCEADLGVNLDVPHGVDLLPEVLPCGIEAHMAGAEGVRVPVAYATTQGIFEGSLQSDDDTGVLTVIISCGQTAEGSVTRIAYTMEGKNLQGKSATNDIKGVSVNFTALPVQVMCMPMGEGRCLRTLAVDGETLEGTANIDVISDDSTSHSDLQVEINGGGGARLEVRQKVTTKPPAAGGTEDAEEKSSDLLVMGELPIGKLVYLKTELDEPVIGGAVGNTVIVNSAPGEDTLFVQATSLANVKFVLAKEADGHMETNFNYNGTTPDGLEVFLKTKKCKEMKILASNIPPHLGLSYVGRGSVTYVDVWEQSAPIGLVEFAARIGGECGEENIGGIEWYLQGEGVPNKWRAGIMLRPKGFLNLKTYDETLYFDNVQAGMRSVEEPDRFIALNFQEARIALEWNIAVLGKYGGDPYIYCDTGGGNMLVTVRMRWDQVGFGFDPTGSGSFWCDKFMLLAKVGWMDAARAAMYYLDFPGGAPNLERYGKLVWTFKVYRNIEFFLMDRWWTIEFPQMEVSA